MRRTEDNIFLVGLMGSGKTTIGKVLAKRLGWRFMDTDHEIEARTGVSIPTIFEIEGESGFRRRESLVIEELTTLSHVILATGGGAVLAERNRQLLKDNGWVAYLSVAPRQLYERTRHDRNRPLLQVADPLARLQVLNDERAPYYREVADVIVDANRMNSAAVAQLLIQEFEKQCRPSV